MPNPTPGVRLTTEQVRDLATGTGLIGNAACACHAVAGAAALFRVLNELAPDARAHACAELAKTFHVGLAAMTADGHDPRGNSPCTAIPPGRRN